MHCTIHFPDIPELAVNSKNIFDKISITQFSADLIFMFEKLIKISKNPQPNANIQLRSLLSLILCEISENFKESLNQNTQNELIISVTEYINNNLSHNLSIPEIAKANNMSTSSLSHIFKKEMNISIHQYIIKKRLLRARRKICNGQLSTIAAVECGFNDYSGFYKQYKKMFNQAPSEHS